MRIGSLFSGAGLLDAGLHQAGCDHAWFVERDEFRRGLLARRFPGRPVHDDVRTVGAHNLAPVDCIAGGFPCKGVSSAGKRTGLAHPETALWAEFERIVRELRPRYVVVENVANLLSLHDGAVWGSVLGDLAALGYDVAWDCVPASAVGAPHGRDRVFAVAHAADDGRPEATDAGEPRGMGGDAWAGVDAAADSARLSEGRTAPEAGADRERTRAGADAAADSAHVGSERGGPARRRRPGSADSGERAQAPADPERESLQLRGGAGDVGAQASGGGREARQQRDRDAVADRAQAAADTEHGGRRADERDARPWQSDAARGVRVEWGEYEPAIRRWEAIHGPAPEPLLSRLDDGDPKLRRMRARVDRSRLSALGDGVHVYVGRLVGEALMSLAESDAT